jgi:hypothetical protein
MPLANRMWTTSVSRTEFLSLLGPKPPPGVAPIECSDPTRLDPPRKADIRLLWENDPKRAWDLPTTIVTSGVEANDFLAWASSYLQGFFPFSAFFRVYDWQTFLDSLEIDERPIRNKIADASAALVVAEGLAQSGPDRIADALPTRSLVGTYSAAAARAIANRALRDDLGPLTRRWDELMALTEQPRRRLAAPALQDVWAVLQGVNKGLAQAPKEVRHDPNLARIAEACLEITTAGDIVNDSLWGALTIENSFFRNAREEMKRNREHRVVAVRNLILHDHILDPLPQTRRDFLLGYLTSMISPGSLSHLDFLGPFVEAYPKAPLWYAVCAGLRPDNEIAKSFKCLGRRLVRDMLAPESPFAVPRHDISLEELAMLLSADNPDISFRRASPNFLLVELLPCVTVCLSWPRRSPVQDQQEFFQSRAGGPTPDDLADLRMALSRLVDIVDKKIAPPSTEARKRGRKQ